MKDEWLNAWPGALCAWSIYTLMREPLFLEGQEITENDMRGQIAATRMSDSRVMVNVEEIRRHGLEKFALPILAHEVGHHVYAPGNATDSARCLAAIARIFVGLPADAVHMAANLYEDLLLNDRLYRANKIDLAAVYVRLRQLAGAPSDSWSLYMRTYEYLWRLPAGTLAERDLRQTLDADAMLVSRIVRHFAVHWLDGARRFATILYQYLAQDMQNGDALKALAQVSLHGHGHREKGEGVPDGLSEIDPSEVGDEDDFEETLSAKKPAKKPPAEKIPGPAQQKTAASYREPYEYADLLRKLGLEISESKLIARYYRERALPHLVPFPKQRAPKTLEPLAEGYAAWDVSDDTEALDIVGSLSLSPIVIPGVTTVQREYGETPGSDPARVPMDLDIYIDCSGSMPDPSGHLSYLALAATILTLSALRAGARVKATLWSGPGQVKTTGAFIRDEKELLLMVTGFISGSTAFPLHLLKDTYAERKRDDSPAHIVVISDDGCDTMLTENKDFNGPKICAEAIARARGGGTLLLNLPNLSEWSAREPLAKMGYRIWPVSDWQQLVAFARAFVREAYA